MKSIHLTIDQGKEVMDSLEWSVIEYEKQDETDREIYKTYRETFFSIQKQLKEIEQ